MKLRFFLKKPQVVLCTNVEAVQIVLHDSLKVVGVLFKFYLPVATNGLLPSTIIILVGVRSGLQGVNKVTLRHADGKTGTLAS
jgi:hypothetical protein